MDRAHPSSVVSVVIDAAPLLPGGTVNPDKLRHVGAVGDMRALLKRRP